LLIDLLYLPSLQSLVKDDKSLSILSVNDIFRELREKIL
jgi:hypothetical protein